jgi:RNA polymerase sigma-70 factor, ECF subfamily
MDRNQQCEESKESERLLEQALEGKREALDKLLASYRLRLYRQALRILGNPQDAEDALQEALFQAARHLHQFEGRSKFSTWLTRIVINSALMARRSNGSHREAPLEDWFSNDERRTPLEIADLRPDPERVCSSSEIAALVYSQFNLLSPALRSAFLLRHLEGLSYGEAGRSLGISTSAAKSRVGRARQQLKTNLFYAYHGLVQKNECAVQGNGRMNDPERRQTRWQVCAIREDHRPVAYMTSIKRNSPSPTPAP